jgi:ubiquitin carboxyl-terminal hydrolase 7
VFGIPAQFQRFWLWLKRQNHTFRPWRPLTQIEEAGPVNSSDLVKLLDIILLIYLPPQTSYFMTFSFVIVGFV